jgi:cytochrome c biogenesis protein CcmG/thiol:disulfide interchange protein DsbE
MVMHSKGKRVVRLLAIGVFCFCVLLPAADLQPLEPGKEAPSFSLPTLSGNRESLTIWCGPKLSKPFVNSVPQVVILSFWATYCVPCQKEIPELTKYAEKHTADKVKVFLINIDQEGAPKVEPFVKEKAYTLPVLLDPYRKTAERFGVRTLPALIVIGPDGIIRYSSVGYKEGTDLSAKLEEIVAAINAGKTLQAEKSDAAGETVAVPGDVPPEPAAGSAAKMVTPKQKWHAVALVETGMNVEQVAQEVGVSKEEIQQWYDELKKTAIDMWGKK